MTPARISAVLIVKNEEEMLARCLDTVKDADEIVICDTGSEDNTLEVAKRYTDNIFTDFKWCDDFAAARNHAKSKATGEWVLSIDADEVLLSPFEVVRDAVAHANNAVNCILWAGDNMQKHFFPRLFRNSPAIPWCGAVHNYPNVVGEDVPNPPHMRYDYSPAHLKDRNRTLRILEKECQDPTKVREHFYLGREYFYRHRYEDAVVTFGKYVQQSKFLAEKAEAYLTMAKSYLELGDADKAREACAMALIINANWTEPALFMAHLAGDGRGVERWTRNAEQWKRMAASATNTDVLFLRQTDAQ